MVISLKEAPKVHAQAGRQDTSWSAVLLDSEPGMLELLARFLKPAGVTTVSKQTTAAGALNAIREHRPDLLILDVRYVEQVVCIGEARALVPGLKTIVLVDAGNDMVLAAALAAGATVAVSRVASSNDLALAVRQAFEPSLDLARAAC